ncbi:gamma-tubulin complex component 4 isoform X2 [Orussus abietinus]|uniref:gamma-tubulin complex component 4 isoform X2 n=1 Tax=Orussus abietinus TaxID=222816 RepID=UPI0006253C19|nr:gamma-tubulin complex component 4 isoform X2 [Orussus abietinus]
MLHEILAALWGCPTSILEILDSDDPEIAKFLHPGERILIKKILNVADECNAIRTFIKTYNANTYAECTSESDCLRQGLYLQSLCDGMEEALKPFMDEIIDLERVILSDGHTPMTLVLCRIQRHVCLFSVLNAIIREIRTQKLHGCKLLQCLHQYMHTGVSEVKIALEKMVHCCHVMFYKQLTSWLLYGHLEDTYKEFFIQKVSDTATSSLYSVVTDNTGSSHDKSSRRTDNDMWSYDILIDMLPSYITPSLATKILTIGQTIIMFTNDPRQAKGFLVNAMAKNSIWGEKEYKYFQKLRNLQKKPIFSIVEFERTIDELKNCVTEHLWYVAVEEAQLMQQLKLIKDFYLIGRGDLFLEFIRLTSHILNKTPISHTSRDVNLAFQMALRKMQNNDESALDSFNFNVPLPETSNEPVVDQENAEFSEKEREDPTDKRGWGLIVLKYKVVWPLHLLFNPKVLDDYNILFRFLLRVKKTQINLWNLWTEYTRTKNVEIEVIQLRNNLIFVLDNLQYYLQVDVLESQYTIMENTMKNTRNFEDIQKAHSVFLANVMSQTFLAGSNTEKKNPVNKLIKLLLRLCDDFIFQASMWKIGSLLLPELEELKTLSSTLDNLMDWLTKTLNRVRSQPSGEHLAQLLLRLDFNRWFSRKINS